MGEVDRYPQGTFSWIDLGTTDVEGAKAFYGGLFGWQLEDLSTARGGYTMCSLQGRDVAGIRRHAEDEGTGWGSSITVEDTDRATARARELGATVLAEPFDVLDAGRMAVIADPTGASLCLWEPRAHIGAGVVNAPGALTWNDLITPDPDAAARFYGELFGWTALEIPGAGGYRVIQNGGRSNGGMTSRPDMPPAWLPYFGHPDIDALTARIGDLGGRALGEPVTVPAGRFAVLADPQGAVFAALTGDYDD
jgi:predicted enzyme related to lactoylglutathione lyase